MALKIKREALVRIVREELARYVAEQLGEAPKRGTVLDDPTSSRDVGMPNLDEPPPSPEDAPEDALPTDAPMPMPGDAEAPPLDGPEGDEGPIPGEEEPPPDAGADSEGGEVADQIQGKTIKSAYMLPKSEIMPGAQELVFHFNEIPDPLHVIIAKTGETKYYFRGLHNELGGQPPDDEAGGEEEMPAPDSIGEPVDEPEGEDMPGGMPDIEPPTDEDEPELP